MRLISALPAALLVAIAVPAAAHGATVSPHGLDSAELRYEAAPGEVNTVLATGDDNQVVTITDSVPIAVGSSARSKCVSLSATEVRCTNRSAWGRLTVIAGDGADTFTDRYAGGTTFLGGDGDDRLVAGSAPVATGGWFDGGAGTDEASWAESDLPVVVSTGANTGRDGRPGARDFHQIGPSVEIVTGSRLADTLTGSAAAETFRPGHGDDTVFGVGGADRYEMLAVPDGADRIFGGGRRDVVSYAARTEPVQVSLGRSGPVSGGPGEGDALSRVGGVKGGQAADILEGSRFADVLDGGPGRDQLSARSGKDRVLARDGEADAVDCGAGNRDVVRLDAGVDNEPAGCELQLRPR